MTIYLLSKGKLTKGLPPNNQIFKGDILYQEGFDKADTCIANPHGMEIVPMKWRLSSDEETRLIKSHILINPNGD